MNFDLDNITSLIGVDKDGNKIIELKNAKLTAIETVSEVAKAVNSYGVTIDELTRNIQVMMSAVGDSFNLYSSESLLRPETGDTTGISNEKIDLEIFDEKVDSTIEDIFDNSIIDDLKEKVYIWN